MSVTRLDMLVDSVDESNRVVGSVARRDVFTERAGFRVAHVFVFDAAGRLLLQKIAPSLRSAGRWGSSVAAYLAQGETYRQAAERRYAEELGLPAGALDCVGRTSMSDLGCLKLIELWSTVDPGPFPFDRNAISALEFVPIRIIEEERATGARLFTPTFLHLLDFYRATHPGQANGAVADESLP